MILESNEKNKFTISRMVKDGTAKKIAKGFYIKIPTIDEAAEIRKKLPEILSSLFGSSRLAFSSALLPLGKEREIILMGSEIKEVLLGDSFVVKTVKDKIPDSFSALPVVWGDLRITGRTQAILESFGEGKNAKELANKEHAAQLIKESVYERDGDRVRCGDVANEFKRTGSLLGLDKEAKVISALVDGFVAEFKDKYGDDLDYNRLRLFESLCVAIEESEDLSILSDALRFDHKRTENEISNEAFFESYFSNYIEGTRFHEDEAIDIVFNNAPYARHEDGHDLVNLYSLSRAHSSFPPEVNLHGAKDLLRIIKSWHAFFLADSPNKRPGEFKTRKNSAGSTDFVVPEKMDRMLAEAFKIGITIRDPLKQAVFIALSSVEVHPFTDGNGRITRLLLNNMLSLSGRRRIVFPTVYRADYLRNLKAFSSRGSSAGIIEFFIGLIKANLEIEYDHPIKEVVSFFRGKNAFSEAEVGKWGVADIPKDDEVLGLFDLANNNDDRVGLALKL